MCEISNSGVDLDYCRLDISYKRGSTPRERTRRVKRVPAKGPIQVSASYESEDRMGDISMASGSELAEFCRNPVE